ncbi:MAG: mechanosensitive ion channel family protein [Chlamydiota bacterium]
MEGEADHLASLLVRFGWFIPLAAILVLGFILHFAISRIYKRIFPKIEKSHLTWDSALLSALIRPLKIFIWILSITYALQVISFHFEQPSITTTLIAFRSFSMIALLLWFALRFIKNLEADYVRGQRKTKKPYDKTTVRAVCQISRIAAVSVAILIYMQTRNINISAILTFGGASGIVIGFAAKDLIANFFGGLMLYLDRPFSIGDWIRSPDREIEGTVEHIGFRITRIRTFSKRPLYVPNTVFLTISVENPSRMSNRQIKTRVGIRYEDAPKMDAIVADVETMIRNHPTIDTKQYLMVRFDEFGPSSLNFLIYCFTKTTNWADYLLYQQDVYLKTIAIIEQHGAECAFPTTTLHVPEGITVQKPNE